MKYLQKKSILLILLLMASVILSGCLDDGPSIRKLRTSLKSVPDYSIVLEDMKEEGNFFKDYFHKYRVVQGDKFRITDWGEVSEDFYNKCKPSLGMVLAGKKDGKELDGIVPPAYRYVGDSRYGTWRTDSRGDSFWEFYGKYRMASDVFGGWYRPVYRTDYNAFKKSYAKRTPYYGLKNQYGTRGTVVKKAKPSFYTRQKFKEAAKKASFTEKVSSRIGRTKTSFRGRSGGKGK